MKMFALISVLVLAGAIFASAALTTDLSSRGAATSLPVEREAAIDNEAIENDAIDMEGFLEMANRAASHREPRRLTEEEFIQMSREPGTIVLDARSREMFEMLHVEGAINLPFPELDIASLAELIPDKSTRILIYCNNNFQNEERAMRSKLRAASLNLSTYTALYTYGYRNIYELGPRKDPRDSMLPLVGTLPEYQVTAR